MITATRYHDISCGHRVAGHESKCAHLHGHNYRVTFTCAGDIDKVGRIIDFSVMKSKLCMWLEENWDHKFLAWGQDSMIKHMRLRLLADSTDRGAEAKEVFDSSIVWVPFNPTAENMAWHLLTVVGPQQLVDTSVSLIKVVVEETRKCSAEAAL